MNQSNQTVPAGKGGKGKRILKGFGILFFLLLVLFLISFAVVLPKQRKLVIELGEKASVSPSDYLFGCPFVIDYAEIDVSGVQTDKVGEYKAGASLLFYRYAFDVTVQDTTPPEIVPFENDLYIATGREYFPRDFAEQISDLSGEVNCRIQYGGREWDSISFPSAGCYTVALTAADASGNEGTSEIAFTVDDPPVIVAAFDRHLPVGTDFDLRAIAADTGDGIITDSMVTDTGGFDPRTEGSYTVTYTVVDSHGLRTEKKITLSVCGRKELSLYKDKDDLSLTADELSLLSSAGYFTYEPLDAPDYDSVLRLTEPTLLDLKQERSNGYASGSGCIYRITPEYIYMLSVRHVVKEVRNHCNIMFFDGISVKENIEYYTSDQKNELALFTIPTADVPTDTLLSLKQVYVDRDVYSTLSAGDEVVAYAKHWSGTDKDLIRRMKVKKLRVSIGDFGLIDSLLETSEGVVSGMSGTAVVDLKGRLVGLASAIGPSTDSDRAESSFHSRIDALQDAEKALSDADKAA